MENAAVLTLLLHAFTSNASLTELILASYFNGFFVLFEACFVFVLCSTAQADLKLNAIFLHFLPKCGDYRPESPSPAFMRGFLALSHMSAHPHSNYCKEVSILLYSGSRKYGKAQFWQVTSLRRLWWCSWSVAGTIQCWRNLWRPGDPYYFLTGQTDTPLGFVSRLSFSKASKHCNLRHFLINCKTPTRSPKSLVKCQTS